MTRSLLACSMNSSSAKVRSERSTKAKMRTYWTAIYRFSRTLIKRADSRRFLRSRTSNQCSSDQLASSKNMLRWNSFSSLTCIRKLMKLSYFCMACTCMTSKTTNLRWKPSPSFSTWVNASKQAISSRCWSMKLASTLLYACSKWQTVTRHIKYSKI